MVISHNLLAMNANRQLGMVTGDSAKNTEKLSSGYKINRAADDAAGLSISEKMRKQIRGLTRASENSQDGVSFVQIADGALAEVHDMLDRMVELTVQAANGTNSTSDRAAIQKEIDQLTTEINRIQETTKFNETQIFTEKGHSPDEGVLFSNVLAADTVKVGDNTYTFAYVDTTGTVGTADATHETGKVNNGLNQDFADFVVKAASSAVDKIYSNYSNLTDMSSNVSIGLNVANIDGKGSTLASAYVKSSGASSGGKELYKQFEFTLNIDSSDYDPSKFKSMTESQKADLAATIAHEMTHIVMQDALAGPMIGINGTTKFPDWFVEGMAQTSSGDGNWVPNGTFNVDKYMKDFGSPYGAGYLATMALGATIGGGTSASQISSGLNTLFGEMKTQSLAGQKIDMNAAIKAATGEAYASFAAFETEFKKGTSGNLGDTVNRIVTARGAAGDGSLLSGDLSKSQKDVFGSITAGTNGNYGVNKDVTAVVNTFVTTFGSTFGGAGVKYPIPPAPVVGARHGVSDGGDDILIHAGTDADLTNKIAIKRYDISAEAIFDGDKVDVMTEDSATNSIRIVGAAKDRVSRVRSYYGAMQNRLEHTIKNLDNVVENTQAAESQIRDTDMAKEMVKYTKNNILQQAGQSMLAQANQSTQGVMSLLQ